MTTHPPGQPDGPTGPGRLPEFDEVDHYATGEPHQHSAPPVPRIGEIIRDSERLLAQALAVLERGVDPASIPHGNAGLVSFWRDSAGFHIEAALRDLASLADVSLPPVGSAVRPPTATGKEPTPGSAAALGRAARESTEGLTAPGAGKAPDPSPGSGAPVSPPARGVGPEVLGVRRP